MQNSSHQSLERALSLLLAFVPQTEGLGTMELSKRLGLHRSTVSRLLQILLHYGLILRDPWTKKYHLGKTAVDLGMTAIQSVREGLIPIAQPYIDDLRTRISEYATLEVMSGDSTILAYRAQGPRLIHTSFSLGERMPVHVAAGAKAILAFLPSETVDRLLDGELTRYTPNTITDPEVLKRKLAEFRQQGVAFDLGERDSEIHVISAPIFNYDKQPVAAVDIPTTAARFQALLDNNAVEIVKETAARISARLFYSED